MIKTTTREKNNSRRVQILTEGESRVEQSHRAKCNINTIIKKAMKTGIVPVSTRQPTYGDFAGVVDYHDAQNKILKAQEDFMALPSAVRKRFRNEPGLLIDFLSDEDNRQEAIELGLIPAPEPVKVGAEIKPGEPETATGEVNKTET